MGRVFSGQVRFNPDQLLEDQLVASLTEEESRL
jgi:hypothetical protein